MQVVFLLYALLLFSAIGSLWILFGMFYKFDLALMEVLLAQ